MAITEGRCYPISAVHNYFFGIVKARSASQCPLAWNQLGMAPEVPHDIVYWISETPAHQKLSIRLLQNGRINNFFGRDFGVSELDVNDGRRNNQQKKQYQRHNDYECLLSITHRFVWLAFCRITFAATGPTR